MSDFVLELHAAGRVAELVHADAVAMLMLMAFAEWLEDCPNPVTMDLVWPYVRPARRMISYRYPLKQRTA